MAKIDVLTDKKIAALRPPTKTSPKTGEVEPYRVFDGKGLHIWVSPSAKVWRLKFRLNGKTRLMSLGEYPAIDCEEARNRREAARKLIARDIDPVEQRREEKAAKAASSEETFRIWADKYYDHNVRAWSESHRRDVRRILDVLNATLGNKPINSLKPKDVKKVIEAIEKRGKLTYARDVRLYFRLVIRHHNEVNDEHTVGDPSANIVIKKAPQVQSHPALEASEVGAFLRKLQNCPATPLVRLATRLLMLTGVRTTELRLAKWSEIDTKQKRWRVPASRTKNHRPLLVPLARQTLDLLAQLRQISGEGELLFPNLLNPEEPMSENAIIGNIRLGMGYAGKATGHGMRGTLSTWAHEQGYNSDAIERQLGHVERNAVKRAYNAAQHLAERERLMEAWANFVEAAERDNANVVSLRKRSGKQ